MYREYDSPTVKSKATITIQTIINGREGNARPTMIEAINRSVGFANPDAI
jgi:hypothetical protein